MINKNGYAKNDSYIIGIRRNEKDNYYDNESQEIQEKIDELVNDRMNDIYEIIEDNKETYILENGEMDTRLVELNNSFQLKKRSNKNKYKRKFYFINKTRPNKNIKNFKNFTKRSFKLKESNNDFTNKYIPINSNLVNHVCPISNYYAIKAYLSDETLKLVRKLKNVIYCEKNRKLELSRTIQNLNKNVNEDGNENNYNNYNYNNNNDNNNNNNKNSIPLYYNINEIKKETNWTDVNVQHISYTPNHLALISQSPYINMNKPFDNNFYYPNSAGKGTDIYLIDQGLIVRHDDFDTSERTITCDAISTIDDFYLTNEKEKIICTVDNVYPSHGIMVTSISGGNIFGVSKKANLHMIAVDFYTSSILVALDHIMNNSEPHKTVISMSLGGIGYLESEDKKLEDLSRKGFITFVAAGNENTNCCAEKDSDDFMNFSGYRKAITVGATETDIYGNGYYRADYSNYGDCVDIYGPGTVSHFDLNKKSGDDYINSSGTSCSTPLVAGVAASIISEHPEITFDNELMRKTLIKMSIKDAIHNLGSSDTPNRFVNNGKLSIYTKKDIIQCGKGSGSGSNINVKCSNGCCSKEGICHAFEKVPLEECFIENGCQNEFGYCTTIEESIEECENEIKDNAKCLLTSVPNMNEGELYKFYNIFNSFECNDFRKKLINNLSICSVAKQYKHFELINDYNQEKYHNLFEICNDSFNHYKNECKLEMKKYRDCFIEEKVDLEDNFIFGANYYRCKNMKLDECSSLYNKKEDGLKKYLPSCSILLRYYDYNAIKEWTGINVFYDNAYKKYDEYLEFCENVPENSVEICNEIIEENEECQLIENDLYRICNRSNIQKWTLWDINPYDIIHVETHIVWIYNKKLNKCLYRGNNLNDNPMVFTCNDWDNAKWEIPISGSGFFKSLDKKWCLNVKDIDEGVINMGDCNSNSIINDINSSYNKESIISSLNQNKCLGFNNPNDPDEVQLKLNKCDKSMKDQHWEIRTSNPSIYIYNPKLKKCLISGKKKIISTPSIGNCSDNENAKWEISISGPGFFKSISQGWCLNVSYIDTGKIIMGECNNDAIINDIYFSYNGESIISPLNDNKCLGLIDSGIEVNMNECDQSKDDQHWEIFANNPEER
ncbi:subtilisin-like protein [Anaeromyces robustus]|uniref:Subtilisin-like protein n=1 Tax=Anaeromyces robustus TaxID=1754192 RepID=A0A1Y1XC28_9FUNG|nr:subtilisin-like protein [Anaeromyces robustus]|eukprot:ORX83275.1 subtilisin-like protein [Anaeromyces robustus]